jgi:hypothetical protein
MYHKTGRDIRRTERVLHVYRYICLPSGLYHVSVTLFLLGCAERKRCHEASCPLTVTLIGTEKLLSAQLRNVQHFVGSKSSLPCSQETTTGPCSEARHYIIIIISGMGLSPLGSAATSGLLYKPQMIDEGDCGAIGGMEIGRGNQSTRRKPAPAPLCTPQIPHDQTQARTRAAAVGSETR